MTGCIYGNRYNDPRDENAPGADDYANYQEPDEFWVSGVKTRGSNRYPGHERQPVIEEGDL